MMTFNDAKILDCTSMLCQEAYRRGYSAELLQPENILIIRDWSGVEWVRFANVRSLAEAGREINGMSSEVWA